MAGIDVRAELAREGSKGAVGVDLRGLGFDTIESATLPVAISIVAYVVLTTQRVPDSCWVELTGHDVTDQHVRVDPSEWRAGHEIVRVDLVIPLECEVYDYGEMFLLVDAGAGLSALGSDYATFMVQPTAEATASTQ